MKWHDVTVDGRTFSMSHLHPFEQTFDVAGQAVTVQFEFGFHCFTDDKGSGLLLVNRGERRYFSETRHHCSTQLADYFKRRFFDSVVVPFYSGGNRRYYHLDLHDYAIFFEIRKPADTNNRLRVYVVSAYEREHWGKDGIPRGNAHNVRYILEVRNRGEKF